MKDWNHYIQLHFSLFLLFLFYSFSYHIFGYVVLEMQKVQIVLWSNHRSFFFLYIFPPTKKNKQLRSIFPLLKKTFIGLLQTVLTCFPLASLSNSQSALSKIILLQTVLYPREAAFYVSIFQSLQVPKGISQQFCRVDFPILLRYPITWDTSIFRCRRGEGVFVLKWWRLYGSFVTYSSKKLLFILWRQKNESSQPIALNFR